MRWSTARVASLLVDPFSSFMGPARSTITTYTSRSLASAAHSSATRHLQRSETSSYTPHRCLRRGRHTSTELSSRSSRMINPQSKGGCTRTYVPGEAWRFAPSLGLNLSVLAIPFRASVTRWPLGRRWGQYQHEQRWTIRDRPAQALAGRHVPGCLANLALRRCQARPHSLDQDRRGGRATAVSSRRYRALG
jgi:hypothetical protein